MDGLFQVVRELKNHNSNDRKFSIIGTAFVIATNTPKEYEYYLLTAYHCICESFVKEGDVLLRDSIGNIYSSEIVFPKEYIQNKHMGNDYALLRLISSKKYETFNYTLIIADQNCLIRGASEYYSKICPFTPFKGSILSEETLSSVSLEKILVMDVDTKDVKDKTRTTSIDQQNVLGGLSGSPILIEKEGKKNVVGIYTRIYGDGSASKCYGIPIKKLLKIALFRLDYVHSLLLPQKLYFIQIILHRMKYYYVSNRYLIMHILFLWKIVPKKQSFGILSLIGFIVDLVWTESSGSLSIQKNS